MQSSTTESTLITSIEQSITATESLSSSIDQGASQTSTDATLTSSRRPFQSLFTRTSPSSLETIGTTLLTLISNSITPPAWFVPQIASEDTGLVVVMAGI